MPSPLQQALLMTSAAGGGGGGDPFWSNVVLMMGFEGTNGSTGAPGFTDESLSAHGTATVTFDAAIDTSKFKAGTSSLATPRGGPSGGKGLATFPTSGDWNLGTSQFTIECFFNTNSLQGAGTFQPIFCGPNRNWYLAFSGTPLTFFATDGASPITLQDAVNIPNTVNWYYACVDFDGIKYRLYDNIGPAGGGSLPQATAAMVASSTSLITISTAATTVAFGTSTASLGEHVMDGWTDEFRITKGVARYHSDAGFTVPTVPFPRHT